MLLHVNLLPATQSIFVHPPPPPTSRFTADRSDVCVRKRFFSWLVFFNILYLLLVNSEQFQRFSPAQIKNKKKRSQCVILVHTV